MPKTMRIMRCAPMADAHAATISEVSRRDFISSKANSTPAAKNTRFSRR